MNEQMNEYIYYNPSEFSLIQKHERCDSYTGCEVLSPPEYLATCVRCVHTQMCMCTGVLEGVEKQNSSSCNNDEMLMKQTISCPPEE